MTLTIAGAGMAGLVAAARARELGARPVVLEKGDRPGGSMLLSSGVVWRYRSLEHFRAQCPGGDTRLQEVIMERLDTALAWLESLGAPVVSRETGNSLTVGTRFDPRGLTDALTGAAGDVHLRRALRPWRRPRGPTIVATGGFQGSRRLVRRFITPEARHLWLRANRWSVGDGLRVGLRRGAALSSGMDEFYGRAMPAPPAQIDETNFVALAQLYADRALVVNDRGEEFAPDPIAWHQSDVAQAMARQPRARAWYVVDDGVDLDVLSLDEAKATVYQRDDLDELAPWMKIAGIPRSPLLADPPFSAIRVAAGITHTIGGLRIDERARVLDKDGQPLADLLAAGADAGGIATGGYASGLAAALVFGRIAAETALERAA